MSQDSAALALEQLPDKAQSLVCSLASTASCPAPVLLALVSKSWAAEAARHLQLDGASLHVKLTCSTDSPFEQQDREVQRLQGLAAWLQQNGPVLHALEIEAQPPQGQQQQEEDEQQEYVLAACQVMPEVIAALAAAGRRPGGLRLQQLRVPAFPGTSMATICRALLECRQLRALHLTNSYSGQTTTSTLQSWGRLQLALQQLTQLTSLRLGGGLFWYRDDALQDADHLLRALPSSLVVLELSSEYPGYDNAPISLGTSSLQHLVSLQQLTLPDASNITQSNSSGSDERIDALSGLEELTYLACYNATSTQDAPLLAAPNLVELRAGETKPHHLESLSCRSGLRSLTVTLTPHLHRELVQPLKQLTSLTSLCVYVEESGADPDAIVVDDEEEGSPLMDAVIHWGEVLSSLTGLLELRVEPLLFSMVDLTPMTALRSLCVDCTWAQDWHTQEKMGPLLRRLAPVRGRLQAVQLLGLPAKLHEGCREAVSAALGQVEVAFS